MFIQDLKSLVFQTGVPTLFAYLANQPHVNQITRGYLTQIIPTQGTSFTVAFAATNALFNTCINKNEYIKTHTFARRATSLMFFCTSTLTYTLCASRLGMETIAIEKACKLAMMTFFVQSFLKYIEPSSLTKPKEEQSDLKTTQSKPRVTEPAPTSVALKKTTETLIPEKKETKSAPITIEVPVEPPVTQAKPEITIPEETKTETALTTPITIEVPVAPPLTPEDVKVKIKVTFKDKDAETEVEAPARKIKRDQKRAFFNGAGSLGRLTKNRRDIEGEEQEEEETESTEAQTPVVKKEETSAIKSKSLPTTGEFLSLPLQKFSQTVKTDSKPKEKEEEVLEWET